MQEKKLMTLLGVWIIIVALAGGISVFLSFDKEEIATDPDPQKDEGIEGEIAKQGTVKKFQNTEEVREFLQTDPASASHRHGDFGLAAPDMMRDVTLEATGEAPLSADLDAPGEVGVEDRDYSDTNIQVEGVDEADIIKTDGEHIYALSEESIFIIKAYPGEESEILSQIKFDSRPQDMYLSQNRLAVFGRDSQIYEREEFSHLPRRQNFSYFKIFDISDKQNPEEVKDLRVEGNYFDSRMIGDYVYFVTSNPRYRYLENVPVLPRIIENGEQLVNDCRGNRCLDPAVYYFDSPYDSYNFTNITAINIQDEEEKINSEMYLFSGNQDMYVSLNNIYISYTKRINVDQVIMELTLEMLLPELPREEQEKIREIQGVEEYILTEEEKWRKIGNIIEFNIYAMPQEEQDRLEEKTMEYIAKKWQEIRSQVERTVIHKIAIDEGELEYENQGEVSGYVLNQFSMSEEDGYFRIATTRGRDWGMPSDIGDTESYSNLYVLDENMEKVGGVENIAPGERIFSARFMQNRAYLVTFEEIDPFFVIDLKDPRNPEILGELKIPGFSDYLHPYDENTVIGIGKETEFDRWVTEVGVKLSLFDVSDVNNPVKTDYHVLGDRFSDTLVSRDHKAFLFSKDRNLLVLPVSLRNEVEDEDGEEISEEVESPEREVEASPAEMREDAPPEISISRPMPVTPPRYNYFRGAAVFHVDRDGFELRGMIEHGEDESQNYSNQVRRSLYIEDSLYTLSNNYLKINNLDDLEIVNNLRLEMDDDKDHRIIN